MQMLFCVNEEHTMTITEQIQSMLERGATLLTENLRDWLIFQRTAGRVYKYNFRDALFVYLQGLTGFKPTSKVICKSCIHRYAVHRNMTSRFGEKRYFRLGVDHLLGIRRSHMLEVVSKLGVVVCQELL